MSDRVLTHRRARQPAPPSIDSYQCSLGGAAFALPVLADLGFDPNQVLRLAGLDPAVFSNPVSNVKLADLYRMVEVCRECSGRSEFGLLVAARAGTHGDGMLRQLAQSVPDVRSALQQLTRFMHLTLRWSMVQLIVEQDLGNLVLSFVLPAPASTTSIEDFTIGFVFAFMRELCGPGWRPTEVLLMHRQGPDPGAYTAFFGASVRYDSISTALIFPALDLKRPVFNSGAAALSDLTAQMNAAVQACPLTFSEEIRRSIRGNMDNPRLSAELIAKLHGIDRRTLSRRLAAGGTCFSELHSSLRFESARVLLRESGASLSVITAALGYSEQSAFSRAFQMWSGLSPGRFRAMNPAHRKAVGGRPNKK